MMLVQFTDMYGKEVWINPDRVCTVTEYAKDVTIISFGSDESGNTRLPRRSSTRGSRDGIQFTHVV